MLVASVVDLADEVFEDAVVLLEKPGPAHYYSRPNLLQCHRFERQERAQEVQTWHWLGSVSTSEVGHGHLELEALGRVEMPEVLHWEHYCEEIPRADRLMDY